MAWETQGRRLAAQLASQYGKLREARLGARIVLVFERGELEVPGNHVFQYGYMGSGPDCFHAFLEASGFSTSYNQMVEAKKGDVLYPSGKVRRDKTTEPSTPSATKKWWQFWK